MLFNLTASLRAVVWDDTFSSPMGWPFNLLANDTDPESLTLAVTLGTGSANGMLALNVDGTFTCQPNAGFTGADIFIYVLSEAESLRANVATGTQARLVSL